MRARYFNAYRLAAYVLVLYALGHTLGALVETPRFSAESDAVAAQMKAVHVVVQGADCNWYGFYLASGILTSLFLVFSAVLSFQLGGLSLGERRALAPVTWALLLAHAAGTVVAFLYLFPVPRAFSAAATVLLGYACIRDTVRRGAG
jgi:Sec-independent protein secretion pathway component TatC